MIKEDELMNSNRFQSSDYSKAYITKCNWKSLFTSANCELAVLFGVNYIDFILFFIIFFDFTGIFSKNIFFLFFFFFFSSAADP
jgi:hypothetical protein